MTQNERRSFFAFLWHGAFLALTMSMLDFNTVFPSLIDSLDAPPLVFGGMYSIMLGAPLLFNLFFSLYLSNKPHKKPYLLIGIMIRSLSFLLMALVTYLFFQQVVLTVLLYFLLVFSFSVSAGIAGLSYNDIIAKTIHPSRITSLFTYKQLIGSLFSLLGGFLITQIFTLNIEYPLNYVIPLLIGGIGLIIASVMFYYIEEPEAIIEKQRPPILSYIKDIPKILKKDQSFKAYVIVENLSSFGIMILPFYMLYAKQILEVEDVYIGYYLLFQISGTIISNILWGYIGKQYDAKSIMRVCLTIGAITPLLAFVIPNGFPLLFGLIFVLMGAMISGRRIGFEPTLLSLTNDQYRMTYFGIRGSLNISIVVLPLIGSVFIEFFGFSFVFLLVSFVMFLSLYIMRFISKKQVEGCSEQILLK
jgi:MFS family permease